MKPEKQIDLMYAEKLGLSEYTLWRLSDAVVRSVVVIGCIAGCLAIMLVCCGRVHAQDIPTTGTATWYSVESCRREGTSGIMANGQRLDDKKFTAASWFYRSGTKVRITNTRNKKSVIAIVCDRGPAKRLVREGKIIDLSVSAFKTIAELEDGVISVKVEVIDDFSK